MIKMNDVVNLFKNINWPELINKSKKYGEYVGAAFEIYESINQKRENARQTGQTGNQFYYSEIEQEKSELGNFDLKKLIKEQIYNLSKIVSTNLGLNEEDLANSFKDYKKFLDGEEMTQEEMNVIVEKFQLLIDQMSPAKNIQSILGDKLYKELTSLIIIQGMELSKLYYQFSLNLINKIELKEMITELYQNYVVAIIDFIKNNPIARDIAGDIIVFATGNKAAAIVSIISKVTSYIFEKFNNKSEKFSETVKEMEKELNINTEKDKSTKLHKEQYESVEKEKWYDE